MKRALGVIRLSVGNVGQTGDDTQRRRIDKRIAAVSRATLYRHIGESA